MSSATPVVSGATLRGLAALLLASAVAAGVLWLNDSPLLPATHADGVKYLSAASSLAEGGELDDPVARWSSTEDTRFLAHFPPGYPVAAAALIRAGLKAHVAVLVLSILGAAAAAALVFLLVGRLGSGWAGALAVLLFFVAPPVVLLHSTIWSEPLYLPLVVALVGAMALWPERAGLHGVIAALGVLVRYVGVAGMVAAGVWAWRHQDTRASRLLAVAVAVVPGAGILAVWGAVTAIRGEPMRSPGLHPEGLGADLGELLRAAGGWLAPLPTEAGPVHWAMALGVAVVAGLVWARALRRDFGGPETALDATPRPPRLRARRRFWRTAALFGACYVATVLLARLLADPEIPFDARIFSPVFLLATMATVLALHALVERRGEPGDPAAGERDAARPTRPDRPARWTAVAGAAGALLWLSAALSTNLVGIPVVKEQGQFYTAWVWFTSDVVEWVEGPSRQWPMLYSNEPWLLHFQTGRTPRLLPVRSGVGDWSAFEEVYRERPGPVVVLYPLRPGDLPPQELEARLGLRRELERPEGVVLVPAEEQPPPPASLSRPRG